MKVPLYWNQGNHNSVEYNLIAMNKKLKSPTFCSPNPTHQEILKFLFTGIKEICNYVEYLPVNMMPHGQKL